MKIENNKPYMKLLTKVACDPFVGGGGSSSWSPLLSKCFLESAARSTLHQTTVIYGHNVFGSAIL